MKTPWITVLTALFFTLAFSGPPQALGAPLETKSEVISRPPVVMALGEQRIFHLPGLVRFSVGGSQIRVKPLPGELRNLNDRLLVKAAELGPTDLWLFFKNRAEKREIRVVRWKMDDSIKKNLSWIRLLNEVEVVPMGKKVLLRGSIESESELEKVNSFVQSQSKGIDTQLTLHSKLVERLQKKLKSGSANRPWLKLLNLDVSTAPPILEGRITDLYCEKKKKYLRRNFGGLFELQIECGKHEMLFVEAFLIESDRKKSLSYGIRWSDPTANGALSFSFGTNINPAWKAEISALEQRGELKILSRPRFSIKVPGEAKLFSGSRLPISTKTIYRADVDWEEFGLSLDLKVSHIKQNRFLFEVQSQLSHLDPAITKEDLPGFKKTQLQTQVKSTIGRPILLTGLVHQTTEKSNSGVPILSQIPLIGALFGERSTSLVEQELSIILVPHSTAPKIQNRKHLIDFPEGPVPAARNWISAERLEQLTSQPEYPWNVFDD